MSDTTKKIIVLALNLAAGLVLGLADIFSYTLEWWGAASAIVVIVLDTWAGIEWIPPKRPK